MQMFYFSVSLFLTDELFELVTNHTNLYAQQYTTQDIIMTIQKSKLNR